MRINRVVLLALIARSLPSASQTAQPDVKEIIQRSVTANHHDFEQDPNYNFKERDRNQNGDKTYEVTMLSGWPYNHLVGLNGKPLPPDREKEETSKFNAERKRRASLSPSERQEAIRKYQRGRERDASMMNQLTVAFDFQLQGLHSIRGRPVWVLRATPKPGYKAPNRDSLVLTGMQGELWIDEKTYQWVRVTAQVTRPVSIEGLLATVEPGTRFELEKEPITGGYWAPSHFIERADAKVLMLFNHREHEDDTFWDYTAATTK